MAEEKKSVIVYVDWGTTFDALENDEAGKLIKHFFNYVRDLDPLPPDKLTQIAFEPIKQQLKRDLHTWLIIKEKRSLAGKISADKRQHNSTNPTHVDCVQQEPTNPTVNVNVNDTVNVNVTDNVNDNVNDNVKDKDSIKSVANAPPIPKKNISERSQIFGNELALFQNDYEKSLLQDFYNYWKEPNLSKTKMRFELQKTWDLNLRLKNWQKNQKNANTTFTTGNAGSNGLTRIEAIKRF